MPPVSPPRPGFPRAQAVDIGAPEGSWPPASRVTVRLVQAGSRGCGARSRSLHFRRWAPPQDCGGGAGSTIPPPAPGPLAHLGEPRAGRRKEFHTQGATALGCLSPPDLSPTLTRSPGHMTATPLDPAVSPALARRARGGGLEAVRQGSDPTPSHTPLLLGAPRLSPDLVPRHRPLWAPGQALLRK